MKTILFLGDSITDVNRNRGDDTHAGMGYPTLVKAELSYNFPNEYRFINRGISGDRIVDLFARIKSDCINLKPDYISILIGVNDVWHEISINNGVSPEKFETVYDLMIAELKAALPDTKIMILEPFVLKGVNTEDTEDKPNRWNRFNTGVPLNAAAAKRIAEKYGLPFVTLQKRFDELCQRAAPDCWLIDGVHPTAAGHKLIKDEWIKTFELL